MNELVALARARPGEISCGSWGNGTILHLTGETISTIGRVRMVHIPYKSSAPAAAAVLGGEIAVTFGTTPAAISIVQAGKLRALGVTTAKRSPALPNVPAIGETLNGSDIVLWSGITGPPGMSRAAQQGACAHADARTSGTRGPSRARIR